MTSVSLLYVLSLYLIGTIIFYEYFIRYILVSLHQATIFNILEQKKFSKYSFLPGNFTSLTLLISIFFLTQKYTYISLAYFNLVLQFTILIFTLFLLFNYKKIYVYMLEQSNLLFILFSFYLSLFLLYLLPLIKDYICFLLFLELLGVAYYFFFLNYLDKVYISFLHYKHFLVMYLLNSFLTTLFFSFGIVLICIYFGTVNFSELLYFTIEQKHALFFIILGLGWKLGLPGLHFFKLELYNYLPLTLLFFFSVISLVLHTYIFYYFYMFFQGQIVGLIYYFLSISITISCVIITRGYNFISGYQFIGYSTLITLTLVSLVLFTI